MMNAMSQKLSVAPPGLLYLLYVGEVMCQCGSLWILQPYCHIEGNMRRMNLGWTKGVEFPARHWLVVSESTAVARF